MNEEKTAQKPAGQDDVWQEVGQQAETLANSLASALKLTWEQVSHETQPHLLSLLRQVNQEVQRLIDRLEKTEPAAEVTQETRPD
jgi:hypothetical protein